MRILAPLLAWIAVLLPIAPQAAADEPMMTLIVTQPDGMRAEVMFAKDKASDRAIVIRTRGVGAPGANLFLSVNGLGNPILTHTMTEQDCTQTTGDGCEIVIAGKSEAYGRIVAALRHGQKLTIGVEIGNKSVLKGDTPLKDFSSAYGKN